MVRSWPNLLQIKVIKVSANKCLHFNSTLILFQTYQAVKNTEEDMKQALKLKEANYLAARNRILGENYDLTKPKLDVVTSTPGKTTEENGAPVRPIVTIIKNPSRNSSPVATLQNGVTNGDVTPLSSPSTTSETSLVSYWPPRTVQCLIFLEWNVLRSSFFFIKTQISSYIWLLILTICLSFSRIDLWFNLSVTL